MMQAYSVPITPPPTTIMVLGRRSSFNSSSLVMMVRPLNGTLLGRAGRVPTETRNLSAVSISLSSSRSTCRRLGPSKWAVPQIRSMRLRSNWSRMTSHSWRMTFCDADMRSAMVMSFLTRYASPKSPRRFAPVSWTAASRRVLDGTVPVLIWAPPRTLDFSMMATFLPSLAAWIAPFCPAGPVPMMMQS